MTAVIGSPPVQTEQRADTIRAWRQALSEARAALKKQYFRRPDPVPHLKALAALTDQTLQQLADHIGLPRQYAIAAVGGYGRGLLYPASDVDILILLPDNVAHLPTDHIEQFVSLLWDIGLEPGIAVRSLRESLEEASKDLTIDTSLLEARAVWGNSDLVTTLRKQLKKTRRLKTFFAAKIDEQKKRHARHNDVAQNLEPNIKESPGGLRDLQTVLWLAKAAGLGDGWKSLSQAGIITPDEAEYIGHHARVLGDLRIRLHYLAGRREDRLIFDYQTTLAHDLRLRGGKNKLPSEALMQRYYLTAKAIWQMNSILLVNLTERISRRRQADIKPIDDEFNWVNGNIAARDLTLFSRDPLAIFRAFLILQKQPEAEFFAAETLRALWRAAPLIDHRIRQNPAAHSLFLQILQNDKLSFTLRRMSRYGILGRYLPAFGRIVGQMQHDLFHVYTVDEHILMVIRNLRRLVLPRFVHEFPFCHELARDFERPETLYLAALFHDIAKGRGGDHSQLGQKDARAYCKKLPLNPADRELIPWLVDMHLKMSATAQKQDLSDPDVIAQFAAQVGTERRLTALYLLTVADIRGTSPHVWNSWKGKLLEDLFRATRRLLQGDAQPNPHWIETKKNEALKHYRQRTGNPTAVPALWTQVDASYFQRFETDEITWHATILGEQAAPEAPLVCVSRTGDSSGSSAIIVIARDQAGLFARLTHYLERLGFDIAAAKIHTTLHGYAIDSFQVLPKTGKSMRLTSPGIEQELLAGLQNTAPLSESTSIRLPRQVKHFPIAPAVTLKPWRRQPYYELSLSCADRPGLLSTVARLLLQWGINLYDARINTLGQRAEDTFIIDNPRLDDPAFAAALKTALENA
ncbi:MAG: [protein-PII] uridylyltransferase, partial [Betaproteobacteria bacterium]|nr:[protein-PII] uridylyltransferase [Betaproteobacteria bacterium]